MLWVLNRTISMRQFFRVPKTNVKKGGLENIHNFSQKVYFIWIFANVIMVLTIWAGARNFGTISVSIKDSNESAYLHRLARA